MGSSAAKATAKGAMEIFHTADKSRFFGRQRSLPIGSVEEASLDVFSAFFFSKKDATEVVISESVKERLVDRGGRSGFWTEVQSKTKEGLESIWQVGMFT